MDRDSSPSLGERLRRDRLAKHISASVIQLGHMMLKRGAVPIKLPSIPEEVARHPVVITAVQDFMRAHHDAGRRADGRAKAEEGARRAEDREHWHQEHAGDDEAWNARLGQITARRDTDLLRLEAGDDPAAVERADLMWRSILKAEHAARRRSLHTRPVTAYKPKPIRPILVATSGVDPMKATRDPAWTSAASSTLGGITVTVVPPVHAIQATMARPPSMSPAASMTSPAGDTTRTPIGRSVPPPPAFLLRRNSPGEERISGPLTWDRQARAYEDEMARQRSRIAGSPMKQVA